MRHRAFSFQIALVLALLQPFGASYCGSNGVPYSLEILSDGLYFSKNLKYELSTEEFFQKMFFKDFPLIFIKAGINNFVNSWKTIFFFFGSPVLGCAQPTCMAEPQEDEEDSVFIANTAGQEDGFFREGDRQKKSYTQSYKPKAINYQLNFNVLNVFFHIFFSIPPSPIPHSKTRYPQSKSPKHKYFAIFSPKIFAQAIRTLFFFRKFIKICQFFQLWKMNIKTQKIIFFPTSQNFLDLVFYLASLIEMFRKVFIKIFIFINFYHFMIKYFYQKI
nr:hypothetical protein H02F09.1 - Caenorhabditis elegans [Caenorhabditis elegans]